MKNIKIEKNNVKFNFIINEDITTKKNFIFHLERLIEWDDIIGYAGYKTKEGAIKTVEGFVFGKNESIEKIDINTDEVSSLILGSLNFCSKYVKFDKLNIFVFPTISNFTLKNLNGVCGLTPWKKTILFFINPLEDWKRALTEISCHEYAHTISHKYHNWSTLLDSIIFEGLAEHFREKVIGGKKAEWTKVLSEEDCQILAKEIRPLFENEDIKTYNSLFFGNEKFKQWTGYSIGYNIIKKFISENKIVNWNEIFKLTPKEILDNSKFI